MSETTVFLAQLMGPVVLVLGIGIFMSREYYESVYRHLQGETLAVMMASISMLAAGLAVVIFHNTWGSAAEAIVSLFGWGMVLKGITLAIVPKAAENLAESFAKTAVFPVMGLLMILVGGYLSWVGYFV